MKVKQILNERLVNSSWLQSVSYYGLANKLFPGEELIVFKVKGNPKNNQRFFSTNSTDIMPSFYCLVRYSTAACNVQ